MATNNAARLDINRAGANDRREKKGRRARSMPALTKQQMCADLLWKLRIYARGNPLSRRQLMNSETGAIGSM